MEVEYLNFFKLNLTSKEMEEGIYHGLYGLGVKLTSESHSDQSYRNRIETGELEEIITKKIEGVLGFHKGIGGFQNVIILSNVEDAFELMKMLDKLPYVHSLQLIKDNLRYTEKYISVK